MTKIKLHSQVDLITNSSTVIFTYSEGSLKTVKEFVNEMLKVFEKDETFDDVFVAGVFCEDDAYLKSEHCPADIDSKEKLNDLIDRILFNYEETPEWMEKVESGTNWCDYPNSTYLILKAKEEKYSELANKLLKYLYSTDHEATGDG